MMRLPFRVVVTILTPPITGILKNINAVPLNSWPGVLPSNSHSLLKVRKLPGVPPSAKSFDEQNSRIQSPLLDCEIVTLVAESRAVCRAIVFGIWRDASRGI